MNLKEARELVGLTQSQLDREAGLAKGSIHEIESGRTASPSWANVSNIIRALQRRGLKGASAESIFPVSESKSVAS